MTSSSLLLRQIHPGWFKFGRVSSAAFRPSPKDECKLSAYDGQLISPLASWRHFTSGECQSCGVMGLTVDECEEQELLVRPSPEVFAEHVDIDFSDFGTNQREKKGKRLRDLAVTRDWLHRAE
jgi:hypothetical protein